jgi:hypothetical protein
VSRSYALAFPKADSAPPIHWQGDSHHRKPYAPRRPDHNTTTDIPTNRLPVHRTARHRSNTAHTTTTRRDFRCPPRKSAPPNNTPHQPHNQPPPTPRIGAQPRFTTNPPELTADTKKHAPGSVVGSREMDVAWPWAWSEIVLMEVDRVSDGHGRWAGQWSCHMGCYLVYERASGGMTTC